MTALLHDLDALEHLLERRLKRTPHRATLATLLLPSNLRPALLKRLAFLLPDPDATLLVPFDGSPEAIAQVHDLNVQRSTLLPQRRLILFLVDNPRDLRDLRTHTPDLLASPDLTVELHPLPVDRPWSDVDRDLRALMLRLYSHLDLNPLLPPGFSLPLIPWEKLALDPDRTRTLAAAQRPYPSSPLVLLIPQSPLIEAQHERATSQLDAVIRWLTSQGVTSAHALTNHLPDTELLFYDDAQLLPETFPTLDRSAHFQALASALNRATPPATSLSGPGFIYFIHPPDHPILTSPRLLTASLLITWVEDRLPNTPAEVEGRLKAWQVARSRRKPRGEGSGEATQVRKRRGRAKTRG